MLAYITAQYCDVHLFHFWKRVTKGKHLWIEITSTLVSQLVDSVMVVTVTFGAVYLAGGISLSTLLTLVASSYAFKAPVALLTHCHSIIWSVNSALIWWMFTKPRQPTARSKSPRQVFSKKAR